MSDFLTSLAARTLGQSPIVAPRLPSRFEPEAGDRGISFEDIADARESAGRPRRTDIGPTIPEISPVVQRRNAGSEPPQAANPAVFAGRVSEVSPTKTYAGKSQRHDPNPEVGSDLRSGRAKADAERTKTRTSMNPSPARGVLPATVRPMERQSNAALSRHETAVAPAIHVTIGRVEVRAIQRPEPARPARREPEEKRFSLGDYLRQQRD